MGTLTLVPRPSPPVPVAGAPASTALTVEQQQLERRRRLGAGWFYWVAGISLTNAVITLAGQHWRFTIGLGTTQLATGLAVRTGRGWPPTILLDLVLIGGFILLGYLALQGQLWPFAALTWARPRAAPAALTPVPRTGPARGSRGAERLPACGPRTPPRSGADRP
jgi:hypothetical protein